MDAAICEDRSALLWRTGTGGSLISDLSCRAHCPLALIEPAGLPRMASSDGPCPAKRFRLGRAWS